MIRRSAVDRAFSWLAEVGKLILTLAFIVAGLSIALWSVLGVNPFSTR